MIGIWVLTGGFSTLSSSDVTDIAKTKLTVDATLFGLSTLSGAIFLSIVKSGERVQRSLAFTIVSLMGISFLSFIFALVFDFQCLSGLNNKLSLVTSMGLTIGGAVSGSLYIVWIFASYLERDKASARFQ
jgi:hypothetical protein